MQLNSIEAIIEDIRLGKPVIIMDDEKRENEGDLIVAAEKITPQIVNFMVKEGRGLLCLTLSGEHCDHLGLPPMVVEDKNKSCFGTPFTISIEAASGVTSGISAQDRARTIRVAVDSRSKSTDVVQPGHIFPLRAKSGGVLTRAGHTEAGCDLTRLAGLKPAAAIIEIMNDDGTMSRRPELETFAKKHGLKIGTIADLVSYRIANERTVERQSCQAMDTMFGQFDMTVYNNTVSGGKHLAITKGSFTLETSVLVRLHIVDVFRDLLYAKCKEREQDWSLHQAMKAIAEEGVGVIILLDQEEKLKVCTEVERFFQTQRYQNSDDSSCAYHAIGIGSQILKDLGVGKMRLLNSPAHFSALSGFNLEIVDYIYPK